MLHIESYIVKQSLIANYVNVGFILNGYSTGWATPVIPKLLKLQESPLPAVITEREALWVQSILFLGIIVSSLFACISNNFGRKPCFIIAGITFIIGYALLVIAKNLTMIYFGRLVVSIGISINLVNGVVYLGEIASPNIRGIILASTSTCHSAGCLLVYAFAPFVSYGMVQYIAIAISMLYIVGIVFIKESPTFYVINGDENSAKNILQNLDRNIDVNKHLTITSQEFKRNKNKRIAWLELITKKCNKKALCVTAILNILQLSSGMMFIVLFASNIIQSIVSAVSSSSGSISVGVLSLLGCVISLLNVEKLGRKFLLSVSSAGASLSMATLGVYFTLDAYNFLSSRTIPLVPLAAMVFFIFSYNVGLATIPHVLVGEMFHPNVRSLGSSLSLTVGGLVGFGITFMIFYMKFSFGSHILYWLFSLINGSAFLFTVYFIPETKGRSLPEIEEMMTK